MQTIFIEENVQHRQILDICTSLESKTCRSLEFRRCQISDSDFDELVKSLSKNGECIVSLIFNVQMVHQKNRFKKFVHMLSHCPSLINLRVHGNDIDDQMFSQLHRVLFEHCPKLTLLDIGDNKLTNKSMVNICSLTIPDRNKAGLEELILSANRSITIAGWTELLFALAFSSRIRRLALDYNVLDGPIATMIVMLVASSHTLTHLDLDSCNLNESFGRLLLSLFTKYPVKLEEIYLNKNPSISESTLTLINECIALKSRQNPSTAEMQLVLPLPINDDSESIDDTVAEEAPSARLRTQKRKSPVKETPRPAIKGTTQPFSYHQTKEIVTPVENKKKTPVKNEEEEIEELFPIDIEPTGTTISRVHWRRV